METTTTPAAHDGDEGGVGADGGARCPLHFDPFARPYLDDPYPVFAELLDQDGPRHWPDLDHWLVARYDQVDAVFRKPPASTAAASGSIGWSGSWALAAAKVSGS
ncbi:MAG: hypothetical protein AAGD35_23625, partial [Actinomycetota bacterium]